MCYKIHKVIFHKLLVYVKICSLPIGLRQAIMEHAGESGVQLSVCVEMEAYSDPVAAASNPFFCKYKEESEGDPASPTLRVTIGKMPLRYQQLLFKIGLSNMYSVMMLL